MSYCTTYVLTIYSDMAVTRASLINHPCNHLNTDGRLMTCTWWHYSGIMDRWIDAWTGYSRDWQMDGLVNEELEVEDRELCTRPGSLASDRWSD